MSEDNDDLWETVAKSVTPLKDRPKPAPLPPRKRFIKESDITHVPEEWQLTGGVANEKIDRNTQRQINKGRIPIDRTIDLHDHTQDRAYKRLKGAIIEGVSSGAKCLLVITGKGGGPRNSISEGGASKKTRDDFAIGSGTLKRLVALWLSSEELSPMIHSYDWAHKAHGGDGALYVMLRRKKGRATT